jgi:hypothetical protein
MASPSVYLLAVCFLNFYSSLLGSSRSRSLLCLWYVATTLVCPYLIFHFQRGMTLASRVQVYTQLSCDTVHRQQLYGPSGDILPSYLSSLSILASEHAAPIIPVLFPHFSNLRQDHGADGLAQLISQRCLSDPTVQAGAARLQAIMITVMGVLSVCTTSWWGHYGQKHGRNKVLAASALGLLFAYIYLFIPFPPTPSHVPSQ